MSISIKSQSELSIMREAGKLPAAQYGMRAKD